MTNHDVTQHDPVAETLARWAELTALAGNRPWNHDGGRVADASGSVVCRTAQESDADFFVAAAQAMPALLAFARDVLGMCNAVDRPAVAPERRHIVETDLIRNAANRHLGGGRD